LCFTDDFTTLPYSKGRQNIKKPSTQNDLRPVVDGESFVFELPTGGRGQLIQQEQRLQAVATKTGVDDVYVRSLPFRESGKLLFYMYFTYSLIFRYDKSICCDRRRLSGVRQFFASFVGSVRIHQLSND
jgi:hypothetical protein